MKSNYQIYIEEEFNQPSYYPLKQTVASELYKPISSWTGRLILPPPKSEQTTEDSVLWEVHNAPDEYQELVGKIVKLQWSPNSQIKQKYIQMVTRDVCFTQVTEEENLHPERLNNRSGVGPLESLAGARLNDDLIVLLHPEQIVDNGPSSAQEQCSTEMTSNLSKRFWVLLAEEPVQITGRFYGLVTIIRRENATDSEKERFEVRHFNKTSKQFDGPQELIRIPQVPAKANGVLNSTNEKIEKSALNQAGWYIYGAKNADGVFITQAIEPRTLLRLEPERVVLGLEAGLNYIKKEIWHHTPEQKGTAKTILLDPSALQEREARASWLEGDKALVIHLFGGIGGQIIDERRTILKLVTGHFAYGFARVVRDPFTDELRFDIEYEQVYAHNPDGIISGAIKWPSYMGDLQRGWLGLRPVSDVIIKLEALTQDYDFDGIRLSPLATLKQQLQMMMARYRIGDGTGVALVTPARSCVQDSNQALYRAIQKIEEEVNANKEIQNWLQHHPHDLQTERFKQLVQLGHLLEEKLVPLGIVRRDWKKKTKTIVGASGNQSKICRLIRGIASWRTMLPRRAHDEMASLLLTQGAKLWLIRTNQVGGWDANICPYPPTTLFPTGALKNSC
ncbi:MAG: CPBP family intramembrane metalloprotease domain-containing protein [Crocosphaera sp.]|nr:CPBP family intramembrane metalloprotease domain-containing protein [Crocosphaera sp.]